MKKYISITAFTVAFTLSFVAVYKWTNTKSGPTDKELYEAIARYRAENEAMGQKELQDKWIKLLNERNPELHDAIIAAMLLSKDVNSEIFLHHNRKENRKFKYIISDKRGDADNILSYSHKDNYFTFDHYSTEDGPSMQTVEDSEFIRKKVSKYYEELGIK